MKDHVEYSMKERDWSLRLAKKTRLAGLVQKKSANDTEIKTVEVEANVEGEGGRCIPIRT